MDWASKIRDYRERELLTQAAFAQMVGVDRSCVSRWERKRDEPSMAFVAILRRVLRDDAQAPA
jgi:DNA-binding transcriptional regulator YiaG